MRRTHGFTLIELLIATSIFSIIILSLYSAFQSGISSYNRVDSAFNLYQTARIVFNRIELDLKDSFIYLEDDSKFKGTSQTLEFFSVIDSFEKGQAFSNICRVKYELNNDILKRIFYQGLDALEENSKFEGEELSSDVKEISFQYAYATNSLDKSYDWQESWPKENDLTQRKTLPLAVKIKLSLTEKDRHQKELGIVVFNKTVPLSLN